MGKNLNAYVLAGVRSDHESTELEEVREKLRLGMHVLLREGSTERNLSTLAPLVTPANAANCSFATDDKLPGDLVNEGHIDHCVRKAIRHGIPPITALQMATINPARHYRLRNFGAVAPRFWADFVVFEDLKNIVIQQTYKRGVLIAENGQYLPPRTHGNIQPRSTMNLRFSPEQIVVRSENARHMKVIEIVPNQIVTKQFKTAPYVQDGSIISNSREDILKLVVVERHRATGQVGVGFVRGFKLRSGALGSTVAHDAHNVVVVGVSDSDISAAIRELERMRGGLVAVSDGQVKAALGLPIAGLVSDQPLEKVIQGMDELNAAAKALGCPLEAPYMTLSFLGLSPIPELKLTDLGLIDAVKIEVTSLLG
ncbi:MAG: Adenine deaminase [Verrucomicrobiales bacterium]|nr:Adenine deaminase [Verrucomicrobiales bacterium]